MNKETKLLMVKLIHTAVWIVMAGFVSLVLFAGVFGFLNSYVYVAIGAVLLEGIILILFRWTCPLTIVAKNYTQNREDNFDIFLPSFVAKHNKVTFTTLFIVGLILISLRIIL